MAAHDPPASPSAPPECGRRLLMNVIEEKAQQWHTRPLFSIPRTNKAQDGYRDIFYWEFANAINRCARWLKEHIGISSKFESITYIGPSDLRYQILMMAAVKTGYVVCSKTSGASGNRLLIFE